MADELIDRFGAHTAGRALLSLLAILPSNGSPARRDDHRHGQADGCGHVCGLLERQRVSLLVEPRCAAKPLYGDTAAPTVSIVLSAPQTWSLVTTTRVVV